VASRNSRNSRTDYLSGMLTFHVKDNADDEELIKICESLVMRIEVSFVEIWWLLVAFSTYLYVFVEI
jgi:hypothetical protein